ncbi:MAG TPA: alpha-glucosidase C-terminal domain-containing protein, partial [Phycisphaeraceae bacterium]
LNSDPARAGNKWTNYAGPPTTGEPYGRLRVAMSWLLGQPGAPMIYYGDEAGMWSPDDPSNRQPMVWPDLEPYDRPEVTFDEELFAFYQRAIAIRRELTPLRLGMFRVLLADDGRNVLAFARELDGQAVCVAINRSDRAQQITVSPLPFDDGTQLVDYLDAQAVRLVPPGSDVIDARPTLQVLENGPRWTVRQQRMTLTLPPYSTAILAPQPQAER